MHNIIANQVAATIDSPLPAPVSEITPVNMMLAAKHATPPNGEVFSAKVVDRPKLPPRSYRFRGTKADHYIKGTFPYRLVFFTKPDKFIRIPIDPITGEDMV